MKNSETKILTLRIPKVLDKKIRDLALKQKRTVSNMATVIIEDYFEEVKL